MKIFYVSIFLLLVLKLLDCNCKRLEGYFKVYKGGNFNQKDEKDQLECAMKCLKVKNCKMTIVKEKYCSIRNEFFSVNKAHIDYYLVKKFRLDSNFTCKI